MKKKIRFKFGLRAKLTGIFVLFGAVILGATVIYIYGMIRKIYTEYYNESLLDIAETAAEYLEALGMDGEEMHAYVQSGVLDERYEQTLVKMQEMRERFELESLYLIYPTGEDTAIWFADASAGDVKRFGEPVDNYHVEESRQVREVYESGEPSREMDWTKIVVEREHEGREGEENGENVEYVISAYYPIKDARGNSVAVIGVDKLGDEMTNKIIGSLTQVTRMLFLIVTISTALLILFVQFDIVRAIRRLKSGVQKLGEGEADVQVSENRRDELGEIARAFNRMAYSIGRHIGEMEELNQAYQKLIPPGVFEILHKESIVEFQLGDQANVNLTVLAMEPEGAEQVMQKMSSKQIFQYINDMLARTVPAVMEHGGAAWNFDRAGVYSFFQNSALDALEAALLAGRRLGRQGEHITAGIIKGQVMVGVAGHEARMDIISISEQARIAAFFMKIGKHYRASVLIGRSAAAQITDFEKRYHVRFLGYLKLSASERLEGVYDVYDGDEERERRDKQRTKEDFERGVLLFSKQNYKGAREAFIDVLRRYRRDDAAREYLELCNRILSGEECKDRIWFEELV